MLDAIHACSFLPVENTELLAMRDIQAMVDHAKKMGLEGELDDLLTLFKSQKTLAMQLLSSTQKALAEVKTVDGKLKRDDTKTEQQKTSQDAADKKKRDQEQEAYEKKRLTKVRRMEAFLVKNLPKVREFAQDDWVSKRDEFDFSVPFIITPAKVMSDTMVDPSNQITGCMQRWKDCYSNTDFARQSGMVHAPVMKAFGKDDADEWLRQVVSKGDLLESALPRYQKHKDSFTLFGYTDAFVNFDTELDYLGSIRFLTHGKLDVVLLPASSCAKASEKRGSKLTLVDAISFVEGISETPAQDIKVVRGTIPEMSIFYTPPGWICGYTNPEVPADASNRPPCCGVRCSILPKKSTEASEKEFVALKKLQGTDSEWLQDLISIVQAAKVQRAQAAPC